MTKAIELRTSGGHTTPLSIYIQDDDGWPVLVIKDNEDGSQVTVYGDEVESLIEALQNLKEKLKDEL